MLNRIVYWSSTIVFSAMMLMAAYNYFTNEAMKAAFDHLGYPDYFRLELGAAKVMGALALALPFVPRGLKYFAYAGFTITLLSAAISHYSVGDPTSAIVRPLLYFALMAVSFAYYHRTQHVPNLRHARSVHHPVIAHK